MVVGLKIDGRGKGMYVEFSCDFSKIEGSCCS